LYPYDIHNKDKKQHAEYQEKWPEEGFDDIPVKDFHEGKNN